MEGLSYLVHMYHTLCSVKVLSTEDMENLYGKGGFEAMTVNGTADNIRCGTNNKADTSSDDETIRTMENRKRKEREESSSESSGDGENDSHVPKKKRVIWTTEMHQKFLDAIAQIGQDRAFPKKIVEVMNEPRLTRENVASHLQKYRICLKKSQDAMDKYHPQGTFHQHYLGSSQLASGNYLPMSSSSNFLNYGMGTSVGGLGASRVRLAPPSYSSFDVSSLRINTGNAYNQYYQRTEVTNKSFQAYSNEKRNMLQNIMDRRPSPTLDDHVTVTGTTNSPFMGLRIANDGKSLLFGSSDRSEIVTSENYSTRNDFNCQESSSQLFPSFHVKNYAQGPAVLQFPDSNTANHLKEPSLPPLPEIYVESPFSQLETAENDPFTFIPQREMLYGTNLQNEDIYSLSSGQNSTSSDQQNHLQALPWETLESAGMDMSSQINANNHTTTSLSPWHLNSYTTSYPLDTNFINQEDSLPPLPSDIPLDFYPDSTSLNPIPQVTEEQSLLPSLPLESQWNVNSDAMPESNDILDQQSLFPPLPSEIPWNLDPDSVPQPYNGNFLDEQNIMSPSLSETPQDAFQQLSSHLNMW